MTRDRGTDRCPAWLRRLLPNLRGTPEAPIADPNTPTSPYPIEQVRARLGGGEWQPGSDLLSAKPGPESRPAPRNRPRFPTGRISAQPANQRLYPT